MIIYVGRYEQGATEEHIRELREQVAELADGERTCVLPWTCSVEMLQVPDEREQPTAAGGES